MISRYEKKGCIAKYAVKGRPNQLIRFEEVLKANGYTGVISNEMARILSKAKMEGITILALKWIVLYHYTDSEEKLYAYRGSPGNPKHTEEVSVSKMKKILNKS